MGELVAILVAVLDHHLDLCVEVATPLVVGDDGFFRTVEGQSFTLGSRTYLGDIVETEHHILRGHGDRRAVGGIKDVVALEHEDLRLEDSLVGQREVYSHLVAVEVGVERRTCQRVELYGLALDELGLERLDTQTVKRRSTVEEHGMALHHILEDIPDDRFAAVDDFLRRLHRLDDAALDEFAYDERLVELGGHEFGQTALAHLQFRTHHDDRACGIVDTLTEQVLAETSLLTLERVRERLERAVGLTLDGSALARVVKQRVDSLLEHTFLVAQDDLGSLDLHEPLETCVADDDTAVEVVEVGGGETSTIQGHEGAQFRRCHGDDLHDHPLGTVGVAAGAERLDHLQTLERLGLALLRRVVVGPSAQFLSQQVEVEACEQIVDSLGTHLGDELVGVGIVEPFVALGQLVFENIEILILGEQVELMRSVELGAVGGLLAFEGTRLDDHVFLVVDDGVEFLGGQSEQVAYLVRQ